MPIRLMSWNIQRFGINKMRTTNFDNFGMRGDYIIDTIAEVNPDILVVIEVCTGNQVGVGNLVTDTSGGPGVRDLLPQLPGGSLPAGPWAVVPPQILNANIGYNSDTAYSEAMAVYFRTDRLDFTGPYKWTANGAQSIVRFGLGGAIAYVAPWAGMLPAANPWNNNPNLPQDRLAGQALFWQDPANETTQLFFPDLFSRNPFRTTFVENTGPMVNRRTIDVYSVHFPATAPGARRATAAMADVPSVTAALGANEVRVIVGDFNVNSLAPAQANVFTQLTAGATIFPAYGNTALYTKRFTWRTMLRYVKTADVTGGPPFYGYTVLSGLVPQGLDNLLTAYGATAGAPANPDVVNRVYNSPPWTVALGFSIPNTLATGWGAAAMRTLFRSLPNFGQIGGKIGASDHMALVIDL